MKKPYQVCSKCGVKYGTYVAGCSSVWKDKCDICGEETTVTEARDWNYVPRYKGENK